MNKKIVFVIVGLVIVVCVVLVAYNMVGNVKGDSMQAKLSQIIQFLKPKSPSNSGNSGSSASTSSNSSNSNKVSCGTLGGSKGYAQSQLACWSKSSCPSGYSSLGATYDCVACCAKGKTGGGSSSGSSGSSGTSGSSGISSDCPAGFVKGTGENGNSFYYCGVGNSCTAAGGKCVDWTVQGTCAVKDCQYCYIPANVQRCRSDHYVESFWNTCTYRCWGK